MKTNFAFLVSLLMMISISLSAQQQNEAKPKGPTLEQRVEKMATDLGLTDTEKATVTTLLKKHAAEMKELRAEPDKQSDAFKAKMKELRKSQENELKALLGEEKYAKLLEIRKAEQKMRQQG